MARVSPGRPERWLVPLLSLVLVAGVLIALRHELATYTVHDLARAVAALPRDRLALALGATLLGYIVLAAHDALALRYAGRPLAAGRTILASLVAFAVSMNIGFASLAGASVRYRFWSGWGLEASQIARGVAFTTVTFWLGSLLLGGAALMLAPQTTSAASGVPESIVRLGSLPLLAIVAGYLAWSAGGVARRPLGIRRWRFGAPGLSAATAQVVVSTLDWALAAAALFVLLPPTPGLSSGGFLLLFLAAQLGGLASHVPGGLGVFETAMMLLLSPYASPASTLPALLAYRAIYYLLPLGAATGTIAVYEGRRHHVTLRRVLLRVSRWISAATPRLLSLATFAAGTILLISGATPAVHGRLRWLHSVLPLGIVEVSHFLGSIAGMGLVMLAFGIARRLDAAYHLVVVGLVVGIVASLLKGLDYEEALALAAVLAVVLPSRRHFYRRAALTSEAFTPGWIAAVLLVLAGTIWLGLFSYEHVTYSSSLWWRFALTGDAPRFLRATVGAAGVVAAYGAAHLLRGGATATKRPTPEALDHAAAIIARSRDSASNIALLGDKALLFSDDGQGFLMYAVRGRTWVALGDPVGPASARQELVWRFREMTDRYGAWPVFYEVTTACLPLYLDLGLSLVKMGEEASVPLAGFSLDGPARRALRRAVREVERAGGTFEIAEPSAVPALIPELARISDGWLADKRSREKGFSVGRFEPAYLARFPVAIVRRQGEAVAFANLWTTSTHEEVSVDLMRYAPGAPRGVMDYLLTKLMLWGHDAGYASFNLGMAPLSGLSEHALATRWERAAALIYRHGENVYGFRGLRHFKEKFDPVWSPRYLAYRGTLSLPRTLASVATLVSGGPLGVVFK